MNHWEILKLEIIGYASTLGTPVLPRVLAPVFRCLEQPDQILLPPFTQTVDEVFNAGESTVAEFHYLVTAEEATPLPEAIRGKVSHDLWVNAEGEVAYDPKGAVKKAFGEIFKKHLAIAEEKLKEKEYELACEHAAIARAVNPSHIDPLVIRGAAERLMADWSRFAFTRHIASSYLSPVEFDRLVNALAGGISDAEVRGSAVMKDMAMRKPQPLRAE